MKKIFFIGLMLLVVSCTPQAAAAPDPSASPEPTATRPVEETAQGTASLTATDESLPTGTASGCAKLREPKNEASFVGGKEINFKWDALAGAQYYILLVVGPNGLQGTGKTSETSLMQNVKANPKATTYKWSLRVYGSGDQLLCNSDSFTLLMLPAGSKSSARESETVTPIPDTPELTDTEEATVGPADTDTPQPPDTPEPPTPGDTATEPPATTYP